MWNSVDSLRALRQVLIWMAFGLAVLAAAATAGRYFVAIQATARRLTTRWVRRETRKQNVDMTISDDYIVS